MSLYELSKKYQDFNPYSNNRLTKQALNELQKKTIKIIKNNSDLKSLEDCFKKSVINGVNICRPGESWPIAADGTFLLPVIQINIADLPFVPLHLEEIKFITLFVSAEEGIMYDDSSFCVRCYKDELLEYLKIPNSINNKPQIIHFQQALDFPTREEISEELMEFAMKINSDANDKLYECVVEDKLFGWPFWCQSSELSENTEFIMQITDYDDNWICGDCPTIYLLQDLTSKQLYVTMQMY